MWKMGLLLPSRLSARQRLGITLLIFVSTAIPLLGMSRLGFVDRYSEIFRSSDARYDDFRRLAQSFDTGENDCVILIESSDMLSRRSLAAVRRVHSRIRKLNDVSAVTSLHSLRGERRLGRVWLPVFPGEEDSVADERLEKARAEALRHPLFLGRLQSADRRATLMAARLSDQANSVEAAGEAIEQIRAVLNEELDDNYFRHGVTGLPAVRSDTIRRLQRDHLRISSAGIVVATIASWLVMRRMGQVLVVVVPPLLGVLWTLGAMGLTGRSLDVLNVVLPAIVLAIGVTDSIHLMFHVRRRHAAGMPPWDAALDAVREIGGACMLTSVTTAAGFGSLAFCDDQLIREFGLVAAAGVIITFLCVVVLVPLLAATRLGSPEKVVTGDGSSRSAPDNRRLSRRGKRMLHRIGAAVQRRPAAISIGAVFLTVVCAMASTRLRPDYQFMENLSPTSETVRTMRRCEEYFGGAPLLRVLVSWSPEVRSPLPELLNVLTEAHGAIVDNPITRAPVSMLSLLESLPGAEGDLASRFALWSSLPRVARQSVLDLDRKSAVVIAMAPEAGSAALQEPLANLAGRLAEIEQRHAGFNVRLAGFASIATFLTNSMISELTTSLMAASAAIFVVIVIAFGSLRYGLVSIIPNGLPLVATAALMAATDTPLRYATMLAFSISLGVAVDDTIHFLNRMRRYQRQGFAKPDACRRTLRRVGPALTASTLLMTVGFSSTILSELPTIRAFGIFACFVFASALFADLVIMPALVLTVFPERTVPDAATTGVTPAAGQGRRDN